jgi:hypothetical protein
LVRAVFHEVPEDVDEFIERTAEAMYALEYQAEVMADTIIRGLLEAGSGA